MKFTRLSPAGACSVVFALVALLPRAAFAQERQHPAQPTRIGLVWLGSPARAVPYVAELRNGLREHSWIEGKNLVIESRYAEGNFERLDVIALELVRLPVDVLVTAGVQPTLVLKKATHTIPIVVAAATDPRGTGLVTARGNVAALDILPPNAASRQLKVLLEVLPG